MPKSSRQRWINVSITDHWQRLGGWCSFQFRLTISPSRARSSQLSLKLKEARFVGHTRVRITVENGDIARTTSDIVRLLVNRTTSIAFDVHTERPVPAVLASVEEAEGGRILQSFLVPVTPIQYTAEEAVDDDKLEDMGYRLSPVERPSSPPHPGVNIPKSVFMPEGKPPEGTVRSHRILKVPRSRKIPFKGFAAGTPKTVPIKISQPATTRRPGTSTASARPTTIRKGKGKGKEYVVTTEPPSQTSPSSTPGPAATAPNVVPGSTGPEPDSSPPPPRYLSCGLSPKPPPDEAMQVGRVYTLAFAVTTKAGSHTVGFPERKLRFARFGDEEEEAKLRITMYSNDFEIDDKVQELSVGKRGAGYYPANFTIKPRHLGRSSISAFVHQDSLHILRLYIEFDIGTAPAEITNLSDHPTEPLSLAQGPPPHQSIAISREPIWGGEHGEAREWVYVCILMGEVVASPAIVLQLSECQMETATNRARLALSNVVNYWDKNAGTFPFQRDLYISEANESVVLKALCVAGFNLFNEIFIADSADQHDEGKGNELREVLQTNSKMRIQIVTKVAPIPWSILYVGKNTDHPSWDNFIGMRHILQQALNDKRPNARTIPNRPPLHVGLNFSSAIDPTLEAEELDEFRIVNQDAWWKFFEDMGKLSMERADTSQKVVAGIKTGTAQIMYFFCHGHTDDSGDPGNTWLSLDGKENITLYQLKSDAPAKDKFPASPLILLIACESVKSSTQFYSGFVPYFLAKGALGVIGTECDTPPRFAVTFAEHLMSRLFDGNPVGSTMLELRQQFRQHYHNPLGLLFAAFCDASARIDPAL